MCYNVIMNEKQVEYSMRVNMVSCHLTDIASFSELCVCMWQHGHKPRHHVALSSR